MNRNKLYKIALGLAIFTIVYNIAEGLFSMFFGAENESLSLLGFGIDSFIEVVSGIGIVHMIIRIKKNSDIDRDKFERTALLITGYSFYILVAGLVITSVYNIVASHNPTTTLMGVIIALISIITMGILANVKIKTGKQLQSDAILEDAECTKVCLYMSIVLLFSSAVYQLFKLPYIDGIGTLGLAYFSWHEGRECFEKVKKMKENSATLN